MMFEEHGVGEGIGCEEIDLGLFMKEEEWI
jgi:hypothetical protein